MNDEEIQSNGRRANRRSHRIHDGSVKWPSVEKEKELRPRQRRKNPGGIAIERIHSSGQRKQHADCRKKVVGSARTSQPEVAQPSSYGRAGEAGNDSDDSEIVVRLIEGHSLFALQ